MEKVKIDPNGSVLKIQIEYLGAITASYVFSLWSAMSNTVVIEKPGNNQNPEDDIYFLPQPVIQNLNRYIQVVSTLKNGDTTNLKVTVKVKVFQGNKKIGEVSETETIEAQKSAISNIYFKLVS